MMLAGGPYSPHWDGSWRSDREYPLLWILYLCAFACFIAAGWLIYNGARRLAP